MEQSKNNLTFYLLMLSIIVIFSVWYISIHQDYPFYFIWDMDHTTAVDTLLLHEGLLPDHISHTAFGMHLFFVRLAIEYHRNRLMRKLDAHNAADLVRRAIVMGVI